MQKHSLILSKILAERGHSVHLVHCGGSDYSENNFQHLYEGVLSNIKETIIPFPKTDPFPGHYIRENKRYSKLIFEELRIQVNEYDIIYTQGFTGWEFLQHQEKIKAPILANFHGFEMFQMAPNSRVKAEHYLLRPTVKKILRTADYVYSFGGKIDDTLRELGISEEKILQHSNGIKSDWVLNKIRDIAKEIRTFTFIGRNERRKGIEELNVALSNIIESTNFQFRFNFIGPIPKNVHIKDDRLHYYGEIKDGNKIQEILQQSDCLVCPSHAEGMPTVILEGMANGLAIIATDVGAVSRMIDGNGILLPSPDPQLIANAINTVCSWTDEELLEKKKKSLEIVSKNFTWDKIVDQKIADFLKVIRD